MKNLSSRDLEFQTEEEEREERRVQRVYIVEGTTAEGSNLSSSLSLVALSTLLTSAYRK